MVKNKTDKTVFLLFAPQTLDNQVFTQTHVVTTEGKMMETLQAQVTKALKQARYNLKDGQIKPEDETTLQTMQADLDQKIADLQGIRQQIASFNLSVAGHYS